MHEAEFDEYKMKGKKKGLENSLSMANKMGKDNMVLLSPVNGKKAEVFAYSSPGTAQLNAKLATQELAGLIRGFGKHSWQKYSKNGQKNQNRRNNKHQVIDSLANGQSKKIIGNKRSYRNSEAKDDTENTMGDTESDSESQSSDDSSTGELKEEESPAKTLSKEDLEEQIQKKMRWQTFFTHKWRIGDKLDVFDIDTNKWFVSTVYDLRFLDATNTVTTVSERIGCDSFILRKPTNSGRNGQGNKQLREEYLKKARFVEDHIHGQGNTEDLVFEVKIQFSGWKQKWDKWVQILRKKQVSPVIAPLNMFTKARKTKSKSKKVVCEIVPENLVVAKKKPATPAVVNKNGRSLRRIESRLNVQNNVKQEKKKAKSVAKETAIIHVSNNGKEVEGDILDGEWCCDICHEHHYNRDHHIDEELLICEGGCYKSFHLSCLGLKRIPNRTFVCKECKTGKHRCGLCGKQDKDSKLLQCEENTCVTRYHPKCIKKFKQQNSFYEDIVKRKFRCPRHICHSCGEGGNKHKPVMTCMYCSFCTHETNFCRLPGTRYNKFGLICPNHDNKRLPFICEDEEDNHVTPGQRYVTITELFDIARNIPDIPPRIEDKSDPNHFRLPDDIILASASMVPTFTHVKRNQYETVRPIIHRDDMDLETQCSCEVKCDERCQNRNLRLECCSKLCAVGGNCGNRKFTKMQYKQVQPFPTPGKGWGLRVMEEILFDEFVIEYVGEVLDLETSENRLAEEASDRHFYQMELENDRIVDAKTKGNLSRFINHSCDPNCRVEKWCVNGQFRLGFFAKRVIKPGEELTYDYNFYTSDKKLACHCGAENCRGTLRSVAQKTLKAKEIEQERKAQKEKLIQSAKNGKLTKRMLKEILRDTEEEVKQKMEKRQKIEKQSLHRLSLTRSTVPGDLSRPVSLGPTVHSKQFIRSRGVFLWRNVEKGSILCERQRLRQERQKSNR